MHWPCKRCSRDKGKIPTHMHATKLRCQQVKRRTLRAHPHYDHTSVRLRSCACTCCMTINRLTSAGGLKRAVSPSLPPLPMSNTKPFCENKSRGETLPTFYWGEGVVALHKFFAVETGHLIQYSTGIFLRGAFQLIGHQLVGSSTRGCMIKLRRPRCQPAVGVNISWFHQARAFPRQIVLT